MTLDDLAELRRWHRAAVRRSLQAGFDLVYVYAGHGLSGLQQFLSPRYNLRDDAYGGPLANRMRLLRELLEDTLDETAGRAAVAVRLCVDELTGPGGLDPRRGDGGRRHPRRAARPVGLRRGRLGERLLHVAVRRRGSHTEHLRGLKQLTTKPVVGVGRFTDPDPMAEQVRSGVLDLVGAARPSIADPFLPEKVAPGPQRRHPRVHRLQRLRLGRHDVLADPLHAEPDDGRGVAPRLAPRADRAGPLGEPVLVVGAGPAGLEAALWLGRRGHPVTLLEGSRELGGRVAHESALPGLAAWRRVADHREQQLGAREGRGPPREPDDGGRRARLRLRARRRRDRRRWRTDGVGRWHTRPVPVAAGSEVLGPDDLFAGARPRGREVVVFDDDHYYLGGVLAELLAA